MVVGADQAVECEQYERRADVRVVAPIAHARPLAWVHWHGGCARAAHCAQL